MPLAAALRQYASSCSGYVGSAAVASGIGVAAICQGTGCYGIQSTCTGSGCLAGYFNADVYINGTTYPPSDERFKKNIRDVDGAIDQLLKLRPRTFEWKEPEKHNGLTGEQIGFIAQEVEKVFPEWVRTDKDGFKALSVAQIEGLEVASIRALKNKSDTDDRRISDLESRLTRLENGQSPIAASFTAGLGVSPGNLGLAFLTMLGCFAVSRRKESSKQA